MGPRRRREVPGGLHPPFTATAWFPPAEISSAGATLKTCPGKFSSRCASQKKRCCEERAAHPGRPFFNAFFSFGPATARKVNCPEGAREALLEGSLLAKRENGGRIPHGDGAPPARPAEQGSDQRYAPSPPPSSVRLSAVHLPPVGEGSLPGEKALREGAPHPSGLRPSTFPQGGRLFTKNHGGVSGREEGTAPRTSVPPGA